MRIAFSIGLTKTFPSPILPVLAALTMASTAACDAGVRQHNFEFDLGQKIDGVFAAAINFRVALLPAKAFHFGNRHALDAELGQGFFTSSSLNGLMMASIFFMAFSVAVAEGDTNNQSVPVNRNVRKFLRTKIFM